MQRFKHCYGCGRELPATLDFFYRSVAKRDGLNPRCIDCYRERVERRKTVPHQCANPDCAKIFLREATQRVTLSGKYYCSSKCKETHRGPTCIRWSGGRWVDKNGYVLLAISGLNVSDQALALPMSDGERIREHRLAIARHLGRPLESWEHVHHINGIKDDNRLENLELYTNGDHGRTHKATLKELECLRAMLAMVLLVNCKAVDLNATM